MRYIFIHLVKIYSFLLSPILGRNCRFYPSCSSYMQKAIQKHGVLKGLWLGSKRLLKCHPYYHGNAMDDVPETVAWRDLIRYKSFSSKENKIIKK